VTDPASDILAAPEPDQSMPSGDAFIDAHFTEALVSIEQRGDQRLHETTTVDPHGVERR
jgi:hypothetical protein